MDNRAWTIPKGEYLASEDALTAACREFTEEMGAPPRGAGPYAELREVRQSGGKIATAWAVEGDFDVATQHSNTFELEWPHIPGEPRPSQRSTARSGSTWTRRRRSSSRDRHPSSLGW